MTEPLDWAQAFAQKGATLIAGTGYQYGDTDFLEYSERLYADFAQQLPRRHRAGRGRRRARRAKQAYLAATPDLSGIDKKALLEATLFGLPMLSVNMPAAAHSPIRRPVDRHRDARVAGPGHDLGLSRRRSTSTTSTIRSPSRTRCPEGVPPTPDTTATYYSGTDGVTSKPSSRRCRSSRERHCAARPARRRLPRRHLHRLGGSAAHRRAATEVIRGVHAPFRSAVFYPMRLGTPTTSTRCTAAGSTRCCDPRPAQVQRDRAHSRRFGSTRDLQLPPLLQLQPVTSRRSTVSCSSRASRVRRAILDVNAAQSSPNSLTVDTHVVGDPSAGMQEVWVTWTGFDNTLAVS